VRVVRETSGAAFCKGSPISALPVNIYMRRFVLECWRSASRALKDQDPVSESTSSRTPFLPTVSRTSRIFSLLSALKIDELENSYAPDRKRFAELVMRRAGVPESVTLRSPPRRRRRGLLPLRADTRRSAAALYVRNPARSCRPA
jgi:hypothetical protein